MSPILCFPSQCEVNLLKVCKENKIKHLSSDFYFPPTSQCHFFPPNVQIMEHYKVPDFHTALEFLSLLARRQGKLRKGGLPDTDKAAKSVLMDWTGYLKMSNCGNVTT